MNEVSKGQVKEAYFRLGRGAGGFTAEFLEHMFEQDARPGMKGFVEEPQPPGRIP